MASLSPTTGVHWRDSARRARFFIIDAQAALPVFLFLLHIRKWTLIVAACFVGVFILLNKFGYNVPVFFRIFRSFLAGSRKVCRPWWC